MGGVAASPSEPDAAPEQTPEQHVPITQPQIHYHHYCLSLSSLLFIMILVVFVFCHPLLLSFILVVLYSDREVPSAP